MHQICVYLGRDGRWCTALREDAGAPPRFWSEWFTQLDLCILNARCQAEQIWPGAEREWLCLELAGPLAYQFRERAIAEGKPDVL